MASYETQQNDKGEEEEERWTHSKPIVLQWTTYIICILFYFLSIVKFNYQVLYLRKLLIEKVKSFMEDKQVNVTL